MAELAKAILTWKGFEPLLLRTLRVGRATYRLVYHVPPSLHIPAQVSRVVLLVGGFGIEDDTEEAILLLKPTISSGTAAGLRCTSLPMLFYFQGLII